MIFALEIYLEPRRQGRSKSLEKTSAKPAFSTDAAQKILKHKTIGTTHRFLARPENSRIRRDRFAVIPIRRAVVFKEGDLRGEGPGICDLAAT